MTRPPQYLTIGLHLAIGAVLLLTGGCKDAKSPEAVENNLATVTRAADNQVADAQSKLQNDTTNDAYEVEVARADGDHKIEIQKCDALEGREQKDCKERADADYDLAKDKAKAIKAAQTP